MLDIGPVLDQHCLTLCHLIIFLKEFFEKVDFEINQQTTKKRKNFPGGKVLNVMLIERSPRSIL